MLASKVEGIVYCVYQMSGISLDVGVNIVYSDNDELENLRGVTTMRDYYAPDWWYEPDDVDPRDDYVHVDDLPDLDHARDHMKAMFEILYGSKDLDSLENHLEEICAVLEMKIPMDALKIRKEAQYVC